MSPQSPPYTTPSPSAQDPQARPLLPLQPSLVGTQQANPPQIGTCPSKGQVKRFKTCHTQGARGVYKDRREVKEFYFSHNSLMETVMGGGEALQII